MKKKIAIILSALLAVALLAVGTLFVGADATEPTLEIKGHALSLSDSIYIKYYVKSSVDGVELIIDGVNDPIASSYTETIDGEKYYVFDYKGLAAKNMADNVYAKAHVKVGDKDYYSETDKYSVLQYAYIKLGKIGNSPTNDEKLKSLLKGVLDYGALAQTYLGYNTEYLANASWYQVSVVGGTLEDESTSGLYIKGDNVKLAAPEKDADGKSFSHWINSKGDKVSSPVTVGTANETYTAVYVNYSTGLTFTSNGDGTCYVSGIGSCTDSEIIIPPTHNGDTVVGIGEGAFANSSMTEITLPKGVKTIGKDAFSSCENLVKVNFDGKESDWNGITIAEGNDAIDTATKYLDGSVLTNSLAYEVNEDGTTCTITGIGGCKSTVLGIPESIDGYTVTAIGEKAFADCTQLTEITIPNTVKTIGKRAFYGCTGITEMTIPESVTEIGTQIFYKASNLTTVNYYSSYYSSDNPFLASTGSIKKVAFKSTSTAKSMLNQCSDITEVVLAEGIKYIGSEAFYNCTRLTSVTIPDSVSSIGDYAFSGCTSLTSITIPNSVTSIGYKAFSGCTSLTSITIPDSVTSIGSEAFYNCTSLASITIPNSVTWIGSYAFENCTSLASITIPDSVTSIGQGAFFSCTSLTSITIPDGVTSIGDCAFYDCSKLKKVNYTGDVESWLKISFDWYGNPCCYGAELYFNGTLVTDVTVPDTITKINNYAFSGCTSLTSITIPDSVTTIGSSAFYNCSSLTNITIPDSVTSIGGSAFSGCTSLTSITIPDSVTSIGNSAFSGCSSLESITIPDSVTSIGSNAFQYCSSLTNITIPDSVTSIGGSAFYNCTSLTSITIPDSVTSIGDYAFRGCTSLTSITIPDSVTSIGNEVFHYCTSLESITIPDSVTSIGSSAFYNCTSLKKVYYNGTADEWLGISIDKSYTGNIDLTSATRYYFSETQPTEEGNWWHYVDGVPTVWEVTTSGKKQNINVTDGTYTVISDNQWGVYVLGEAENWEVTMTLKTGVSNPEYGLQICGKDDNGDGLILENDDSFLQIFVTNSNKDIQLIGCDNSWSNVSGYQWGNNTRYTGLGYNDELTLTVKLDGKNLSYWVDGQQLGDTIVLDDSVMYGNVVTLFMRNTDTSISNVSFKGIKVIDATGGAAGENKMGDVATVTKKYFAVSYTMMASTYAGDPADNGCCGLFFGDDYDNTCVYIPYDGTTDTQRKIGIWDRANVVFGNWWGSSPKVFDGSTAATEITPDTEITILVLGVKNDDGTTTVSAYINGTQVNVWGQELTATGDFNGQIGWATKLAGQAATVKFIESDGPISVTVFD